MSLINFEANLITTWSTNYFIIGDPIDGEVSIFALTDRKLYIRVVPLLTQDINTDQLKSIFKRKINCNKYQRNLSTERWNQDLDYLIDPSFQGLNKRFVLLFKDTTLQTSCKLYFQPTTEVMING